jgi:hypothetical protein
MYGYFITFILIFMTHPGVVYTFFDPGVPGGLVQACIVLLLQSPSDGKASFANTMSILYCVFLGVWAYIKVRLLLSGR